MALEGTFTNRIGYLHTRSVWHKAKALGVKYLCSYEEVGETKNDGGSMLVLSLIR